MERIIENNQVTISGEIVSNFEFSHEICGKGIYTTRLASERMSTAKDIIPIMVSDRLIDVKMDWIGHFVKITGQFRSYNQHENNKSRLILSVFARKFEILENEGVARLYLYDENNIFLDGYVCKPPVYRKTPLGREIADILIAVNRPYGKSDYIPCIAWGKNARFVGNLEIGARLKVYGRIQSRGYKKKISDDEVEKRIAYEVSINKLEVMEETGNDYAPRSICTL